MYLDFHWFEAVENNDYWVRVYMFQMAFIYIYVCGFPPRPTFQVNLVVFTVFFLTFWTLQLRAFSGDQKWHFFAILFPLHPSLSTSDTRFKIQGSEKTS